MYYTTRTLQQLLYDEQKEAYHISKIKEVMQHHDLCFRYYNEVLYDLFTKKGYKTRVSIERKCKEQGIAIKADTISNWYLANSKPSRNNLYIIAIVMKLTLDETIWLFEHVCFQRAFNFKKPIEIIYYFTIKNRLSYQICKEMIDMWNQYPKSKKECYIDTIRIKNEIERIKSKKQLMNYLFKSEAIFEYQYVSSKKQLNQLLKLVKGSNNDLLIIEKYRYTLNKSLLDQMSVVVQDYVMNHNDIVKLKQIQLNSDYFLIKSLFQVDPIILIEQLTNMKQKYNQKIKNHLMLNMLEVIEGFLTTQSLNEVINNHYVNEQRTRNFIIILYFYWFSIKQADSYENKDGRYQNFVISLNELLESCGHRILFVGNPFDWIIMYCIYQKQPLHVFREEMKQLLEINGQ